MSKLYTVTLRGGGDVTWHSRLLIVVWIDHA